MTSWPSLDGSTGSAPGRRSPSRPPTRKRSRSGRRTEMKRNSMTAATKLVAVVCVLLAATLVVGPLPAARDGKAPRIVAAAMQDVDGDARADRLRLVYSEAVRHAADRDGRFPFSVAGYRFRSVGRASGKAILVQLVERSTADGTVRPVVRYRPDVVPARARQRREPGGTSAVPWHEGAREDARPRTPQPQPTAATDPSADGDGSGRRTESSTGRTVRPGTRRSAPGRSICPISGSSTPIATASTAPRRTRSSSAGTARTAIPARGRHPSSRSRPASSRRPSRARTCTWEAATTRESRR